MGSDAPHPQPTPGDMESRPVDLNFVAMVMAWAMASLALLLVTVLLFRRFGRGRRHRRHDRRMRRLAGLE